MARTPDTTPEHAACAENQPVRAATSYLSDRNVKDRITQAWGCSGESLDASTRSG